jgi:hypothetical protein
MAMPTSVTNYRVNVNQYSDNPTKLTKKIR